MAECESFECLRDLSGLSIREKKSISRVVYYTINNFSVFSLCKSFKKELKRDFLKIKKIKNIYILLKKHSSLSLSGTRGGATRHRQSFDLKCKRPNRSGGRPPGTHDRLCFSFRFFFLLLLLGLFWINMHSKTPFSSSSIRELCLYIYWI